MIVHTFIFCADLIIYFWVLNLYRLYYIYTTFGVITLWSLCVLSVAKQISFFLYLNFVYKMASMRAEYFLCFNNSRI